MAVAKDAFRVEGLSEFLARMKALEVATPNRVTRLALNEAADVVVKDARRLAPVRTGALQGSIRATSTGKLAQVSEGGARVPYAGFIDYGNRVRAGRGKVGPGDSQPRPFVKTGRILYPAFKAQRLNVLGVMEKALVNAAESVGIKVTSHGG